MSNKQKYILEKHKTETTLCSPAVGTVYLIVMGPMVANGKNVVGYIEVLGQQSPLCTPEAVAGLLVTPNIPTQTNTTVTYGTPIFSLSQASAVSDIEAVQAKSKASNSGLSFCSPTSGRFYLKQSPEAPDFVAVGDRIKPGDTVCLLEVMKTYHRVHYEGKPATITAILPSGGDDIEQGDILLELT